MKKVGIGFAILFLVSALSYAGYWGVHSFLTKKAVKELVNNKDGNLKIGSAEANVSAFPFLKNILLKDIVQNISNKASIELDRIEIEQHTLSSEDFLVKNIGVITFNIPEENITFGIRFAKDTEIVIKRKNDSERQILVEYKGSGYQILDSNNKALFAIKTSNSDFSLLLAESIFSYKAKDSGSEILDPKNNVIASSGASFSDIYYSKDKATQKISAKIAFETKDSKQVDLSDIYKELGNALATNNGRLFFDQVSAVAAVSKPKDPISFSVDTEFDSIPTTNIPGQILDFKLKTFEIVTAAYKFGLSGSLNTVEGDLFPFGKLTLTMENFDKIIDQIKQTYIEEIAVNAAPVMDHKEINKIKKGQLEHKKTLLNANERLSQDEILNETTVKNDAEYSFSQRSLKRKKTEQEEVLQMIEKVRGAIHSLAQKNPLSKGDLTVLAISRDKNSSMDAMINNKPLSQIVMEFMAQEPEAVIKKSPRSNAAHLDLEESIQ